MKFLSLVVASSLLFLVGASPVSSHPRLRRSRLPAVKDSYIVVLKENASKEASLRSLDDLIITFDDKDSFKEVVYDNWSVVNGYSARLSGKALEHVLNDPNVDYVEEDGIVTINTAVKKQETVTAQDDVQAFAEGGLGTDIVVVDTGIRTTHTSFGGRAIWGAVFGGYPQADGNGHGTAVASAAGGTGFGPAVQARLIAVKVLSDAGSGTNAQVISGINYAAQSFQSTGRPTVAVLAIGGGASTAVDDAVRSIIAAGVHVTVAAGGSNVDAGATSPSRVVEAVTVGAITAAKVRASFSSFGSVIDVWFLGVSVSVAWSTSDTAVNTISGTSTPAGAVGGILAVAISRYGNKTPAALQVDLKANAVPDVTGVPTGTTNRRAVLW